LDKPKQVTTVLDTEIAKINLQDPKISSEVAAHFISTVTGKTFTSATYDILNLEVKVDTPFTDERFMFGISTGSLHIASPSNFIKAMKIALTIEKDKLLQVTAQPFHLPPEIVSKLLDSCKIEALGCPSLCPFCKQKCSQEGYHVKHQTEYHLLNGFGGCHYWPSKKVMLYNCQDTHTHMTKWVKVEKDVVVESLLFPQYIAKYYKNWNIAPISDATPTIEQKKAWWRLRTRICAKYDIKDDTPAEWATLSR